MIVRQNLKWPKLIKMKIKTVTFLILALHISFNIYSQKIIVNGQESTGKLNWDDFTGKVIEGSPFNAFTSYKFNTKFANIKFISDSAIVNGFEVVLEFDNINSWAKKDKVTDNLLVHEQGHFDIGILCTREIMAKFKEAKFTKENYRILFQNIINDASKKYKEMGIKYDDETDHSKNTKQQIKWNSFFSEQLGNN